MSPYNFFVNAAPKNNKTVILFVLRFSIPFQLGLPNSLSFGLHYFIMNFTRGQFAHPFVSWYRHRSQKITIFFAIIILYIPKPLKW